MRKAYIVLVHTAPEHLIRLIDRLDDGCSMFFIHIDKKSSIDAFHSMQQFADKIDIVERVVTNWGEFGIVEATINAMKRIKQSGIPFERITLLSGQDYPIKDNAYMDRFFASSAYRVFLEYVSIPDSSRWKPGGGMYRVNKYFMGFKWYQRLVCKTINLAGRLFPMFKRNMPKGLQPFGGSQWWTIDMYALEYILHYIEQHPEYTSFHKYTFAPDEIFFHSILLNANDTTLRNSIVNDNHHFIKWKNMDASHPDALSKPDIDNIIHSPALFARKIDPNYDTEICNLIDEKCLRNIPSG